MKHRWKAAVAAAAIVLSSAPWADVRAGDSAQTIKELQELLASLEHSTDAGERRRLVAQLGRTPNVRAAERLRKLARQDPDTAVRVAAIQALGAMDLPEALEFLLELVPEGGTRDVRQAKGRAVARRGGRSGLAALLSKTTDDLGRGLIAAALAEDPSLEAGGDLELLARSADVHVRCEALRALARHPAGKMLVPDVLRDVLRKHHDLDTILAALDVAESLADADFRPLADLLSSYLEPEVQTAVEAVRRRLAYLEKVEAAKAAAQGGEYAPDPATAPAPPAPRPRVDIVFMFDASGSVTSHMDAIAERIRREALTLSRVGTDFRIGVIAYRDPAVRRETWPIRVLPLTYDLAKADAFVGSVEAKGTGSGAAVTDALHQAMDRMGWRPGALRQVGLIVDSRTGDAEKSREIVRMHYEADGTRLHCWYLFRTRTQIPDEVVALARIGGGVVESLE